MASENTSAGQFSNPMAELRRRKATGEISADEFQRAKGYLQEEMAKQANTSEPVGPSKVSWRTVILAAVVGFMFFHWYAPNTSSNTTEPPLGKADGTTVMPPSVIEMLHADFVGDHSKAEIETEMKRAARVFNLPATDHYFNKMGSALVGIREETRIPEMKLLNCARSMGEEVRGNNMNLDFPSAVGLCAASLE